MVAFRAVVGGKNVFDTTVTFDSTGAVAGDLLLFYLVVIDTYADNGPAGAGVTPPSGAYTLVASTADSSGGSAGVIVWSKIAGASEPTTHAFTLTSSFINHWACLSYSPESAASITVGEVSTNFGTSDTWTATAVDVVNSDAVLVTATWALSPDTADGQTARITQVGDFTDRVLKIGDDSPGVGDTGVRAGGCTLQTFAAINLVVEGDAGGDETPPPTWPPTLEEWTHISPPGVFTGAGDYFTQGVSYAPSDRNTVYLAVINFDVAATYCGVWKSTSAGQPGTWTQMSSPSTSGPGQPVCIVVDPSDANHLWVGAGVRGSSTGLWHSTDGGTTWSIPSGWSSVTPITDVYHVAADPSDFNHLLVSYHSPWGGTYTNKSGILRSTNGGTTWSMLTPGAWSDIAGCNADFLYSPNLSIGSSGRWIFGTQGDGRWLTNDYGATWTQVSTVNMDHGGQQLAYLSDGSVVITGVASIEQSTDNGASWTSIGPGTAQHLCVATNGPSIFTHRHSSGTQVKQALVSAPTTWTNLSSHVFPVLGSASFGGGFQLKYDSAKARLYIAATENGLWVYQFSLIEGTSAGVQSGLTATGAGALRLSGAGVGVQSGLTAAVISTNSSTNTGVGTGLQSGLTTAGIGVLRLSGTAAGGQSGLSGSSVVTQKNNATGVGAQSGLSGAGIGAQKNNATSVGLQSGLISSVTGNQKNSGIGAGVQSWLTGNATGIETIVGTVTGSQSGLIGAAGSNSITATSTGSQLGLTGAAIGAETLSGTGAGNQSGLTSNGSVQVGNNVFGNGSGFQSGLGGSATGTETVSGTIIGSQSGLTGLGSLLFGSNVTGSVIGAQSGLTSSGAGFETLIGASAGLQAGLSGATSGALSVTSAGTGSQSGLTGTSTGIQKIQATVIGSQSGLVGFSSSTGNIAGSVAGAQSGLDALATAILKIAATVVTAQSGLTTTAIAPITIIGNTAGNQIGLNNSSSAVFSFTAIVTGNLSGLTAAVSGNLKIQGTSAGLLPSLNTFAGTPSLISATAGGSLATLISRADCVLTVVGFSNSTIFGFTVTSHSVVTSYEHTLPAEIHLTMRDNSVVLVNIPEIKAVILKTG